MAVVTGEASSETTYVLLLWGRDKDSAARAFEEGVSLCYHGERVSLRFSSSADWDLQEQGQVRMLQMTTRTSANFVIAGVRAVATRLKGEGRVFSFSTQKVLEMARFGQVAK